jgi:hypothetical protein
MTDQTIQEQSKYLRAVIVSVNIKSIRCKIHAKTIDPIVIEHNLKDNIFYHSFEYWTTDKRKYTNSNNYYHTDPVKATFKLKNTTLYDQALSLLDRNIVLEIQNGIVVSLIPAKYQPPDRPRKANLDEMFWSK